MDREDGLVHEKPAVVLLKHIHELWPDGDHFVPTKELIDLLVIEYPNVWGEESPYGKRLTEKRLGGMLAKGYKIHSDREGRGTPRGYFHSAFTSAWHRMGVTLSHQSGESGASGEHGADDKPDSPDAPHVPDSPGRVVEPVQLFGTCEVGGDISACLNNNCRLFGACVLDEGEATP